MVRQTRQRAAIQHALKAAGRPLTPQELFDFAQTTLPSLGLRTVYRQVSELVEAGQLIPIHYPGQPVRYELPAGKHIAHFICRKCQKVFAWDLEVPDVQITPPEGFTLEGQETIFFGICPNCQDAETGDKTS